jgi:glycosyltransferase involved in cell wall biosynthesis
MPDPMISVVMPIYNAGAFLPTAIESIINQTYTDFELLLINDCSTDGSLEVMQRYAAANPALRVIQTERNLGLIGSLNVGFAAARGTYIARMDQDDIALPARFEKQVAFLEANPDVAIVGSHVQVISDSGRFGEVWHYPTTREGVRKGVAEKVCFAHPAVMIRRSIFSDAALTPPYRQDFKNCEDVDLWKRICSRHAGANIDEVLLHYRIHSSNMSTNNILSQSFGAYAAIHELPCAPFTRETLLQCGVAPEVLDRYIINNYAFWIGTYSSLANFAAASNILSQLKAYARANNLPRPLRQLVLRIEARLFRDERRYLPAFRTYLNCILNPTV